MAEGTEPGVLRAGGGTDRRGLVLAAALETFLRYGYRKTSMADIARAAAISRPGLYFLFTSKQELFAAAVTRALEQDLRTAGRVLSDETRPLQERLLEAFDQWSGRYLGAVGGELSAITEAHRDMMSADALDAPRRFQVLVIDAISNTRSPGQRMIAADIGRTLISTAIGLKHQTTSRETFRQHLSTAISLLLP